MADSDIIVSLHLVIPFISMVEGANSKHLIFLVTYKWDH
jgi:hypothetical protein